MRALEAVILTLVGVILTIYFVGLIHIMGIVCLVCGVILLLNEAWVDAHRNRP